MENEGEWWDVDVVDYREHRKSPIKISTMDPVTGEEHIKHVETPSSLLVKYECNNRRLFSEWICLNHTGYVRNKALQWLKFRLQNPSKAEALTIEEIVNDQDLLIRPSKIYVIKQGKYERIIDYRF
jgi:DNA repair protein RadD